MRAVFGHAQMAVAAPADDSASLLLWNGASWEARPSPTGHPVLAVGAAGVQTWIVGGVDGAGSAARWENDAFVPVTVSTTEPLIGIDGDANGNLFAVTATSLLRLKDDSFEVVAAAPEGGFSGALRSDLVGGAWVAGNEQGTLRHFMDGAWTTVKIGSGRFQSISGSNPNDLWVVGTGGFASHWDGTKWSDAVAITSADLHAVRMAGSVMALAVGANGTVAQGRCATADDADPPRDGCRYVCRAVNGLDCAVTTRVCS